MANNLLNKELNKAGNRRGLSQNSLKNLHPRLKGNNHAKTEFSITRKQREMLPLPCPYAPNMTWLEWLAERGMALAGENATYYKELMDRLEGKVTQPIGGDEDKPIKVIIQVIDKETAKVLSELVSANN